MKSLNYFLLFSLMFYFNSVFTICSMSSNSLFGKNFNHLEKVKTFSEEKIKINIISSTQKGSLKAEHIVTPRFLEKTNVKSLVDLQGWLKYLELTENQRSTPASFKKNRIFYKQKYDGFADPKWKIPNENYFYFELKDNTLSVYTTSGGFDRKIVQSMMIDNLVPVISTSPVRGGVEDIGNFDEGYCFMLKFVKSMKHYIWEICADSLEIKDNWMQAIIRLNQLQAISRKSKIRKTYTKVKNNLAADSYVQSPLPVYGGQGSSGFVLPRTLGRKNKRRIRKLQKSIITSVTSPAVGSINFTPTPTPVHSLFGNINSNTPNLSVVSSIPNRTSVFTTTEKLNFGGSTNVSQNLGNVVKSTISIPINQGEGVAVPNPKKFLRERTLLGSLSNPLITQEIIKEDVQPGFVAGQWSPCSKPCGEGIQTRTLSCVKPDKCSGEVVQKKVCNIKACKADVESHMEKLNKVAEGRWEYLGNWSPCSKPCGGGSQTIKRICLGQGNCIGESILTKPCNFFTCNEDSKTKIDAQGSLKECKNLHGEFRMLVESSKEYLPANVEINMNNVEVSYQNDPLHPLVILQLSNLSQIKASNKYPGCLKLVDDSGRVRLCTPPTPEESAKDQMCQIWVKKIQEFKKKCSNQALEKIINEIQSSATNSKDPFKQIDILQKKLNIKESKDNEMREKKLLLQFEEFKKQAKELIEKEEAYEKKLENQEKDRIECEEKKMTSAIQKEEAVANKILLDIQNMTNAEKSYKIKENAIKREMKSIMKNIQGQILNKRENLINKIQTMRKEHDVKQNSAMKHLLNTKRTIGEKLTGLNKRGKAGQCIQKRYDTISIQSYCNNNFLDSTLRMECAKPEQFCYMCCDKETDVKSKTDITCCYNLCDSKPFDLLQCKSFYDKNRINTGVLPDDLLI
jgi:hypothetical protein